MFVKAKTTELLVIQPTSFCNINCRYCYLADRASKQRMDIGTFRKILVNLAQDHVLAPNFELIWHAGEPLVVGPQFYREARAAIDDVIPGLMEVQTIQTNATLIDDEWCQTFKDLNIVIGVSIDGPKDIHDANRVTRAGKGTYDSVMRGIDVLKRNGVDFYVISVLTEAGLREPETLFDFAKTNGLNRIGFNVEETEGSNVSRTYADPEIRARARCFYDLAVANALDPSNPIWIREVSETMRQIEAGSFGDIGSLVAEPLRTITIDTKGNWATYCPELMGQLTERHGRFTFGNLAEGPISTHVDDARFHQVVYEVQRGIDHCRENCGYFSVCGGGRPANKYGEHKRFDVGETMQCQLTVKELTDACVAALSQVISEPASSTHLEV